MPRMASLRVVLIGTAALLGVYACGSGPENLSNSVSARTGTSGTGGALPADQNLGGSKSHAFSEAGGQAGARRNVDAGTESAGEAGSDSGGSGPTAEAEPPPKSCDLNETCTSNCEDRAVTCGIDPAGFACEFQGFQGATAKVSCGQRVVIGTACCGGCDCVPVEVYFDGTYCWQGVPQCKLGEFTNQMFFPHLATAPNTSFVPPSGVPGSFYLGSGGVPAVEVDAGAGGEAGSGPDRAGARTSL